MNWDFALHNTQYLTHGFHTYPAKMIPQIADKLLNEFGKNAQILFDPYCGTGTSLVEGKIRNINSIGFDLNPLALLIAKTKTTHIEEKTLKLYLENFHHYIFSFFIEKGLRDKVSIPNFHNIDFWFAKRVQKDLAHIKYYILNYIDNENVKDFFWVAFSQTIRLSSWTRNDEFKLYKMTEEKMKLFKPEVFIIFESLLSKNYFNLLEFNSTVKNDAVIKTYRNNSCLNISKKIIKPETIDIVLTSPPYGDSSTTVAYGQFSALANQWIFDMNTPRNLDKELMGGIRAKNLTKFKSEILNTQVKEISLIDQRRSLDVVSFYRDYQKSIYNISLTIKPKGFACYVVSNRTVKGINLQTNTITIDFFRNYGFSHIETFERKISNKRLPQLNSPNGKLGNKTDLMNKEYIVIMQKK